MQLDNKIEKILSDGGRAVILGMGISNTPLARMLCARGLRDRLIIRDMKTAEKLGGNLFDLRMMGSACVLGQDPTVGLCDRDDMSDTVIFRSPGIRPDAGDLPEAVRRGATLTSEMEWFCDKTKAGIIAVTGSDGKTTTTTVTSILVSEALGREKCSVGGNIGTPLLDKADEMTDDSVAVLELSSFQLQTMDGPARRAAITNITPNHLNWHTSMEEYTEAKYRIFGDRTELLVLNAKNPLSRAAADRFGGHVTFFTAHNAPGEEYEALTGGRPDSSAVFLRGKDIVFSDGKSEEILLRTDDIKIPGIHNVENYMTAAALTRGIAGTEILREVAGNFGGVPHRFELVRELDGVKYYNSSIDSTPTRTIAALSNLDCRPVVICGGRDKHLSFAPLAEVMFEKASAVVLTGEAVPQIADAIKEYSEKTGRTLKAEIRDDFADAVNTARSLAVPGSAVILSPACTSFDRFANFEERGNYFKDIVKGF